MKLNRKLRMGMIGGGRGAFIGSVHRMAARLDGEIDLVAGCFSSDPEKSKASGADLFLDPARVYGTYQEMAKAEAALPDLRRQREILLHREAREDRALLGAVADPQVRDAVDALLGVQL